MRLRVSGSYQTVPAHFWVIFSVRQLQMSLATCLRGPDLLQTFGMLPLYEALNSNFGIGNNVEYARFQWE